jgi:hypothetical protein
MVYQPNYDTTIRISTVTERHNTMHTQKIDWENYPFNDPFEDPSVTKSVEQLKEWLRMCEQYETQEVYASNYGGWPGIFQRVIGVGMASAWPYWKPRPVVLVRGHLGTGWYDWTSLTGVSVRGLQ